MKNRIFLFLLAGIFLVRPLAHAASIDSMTIHAGSTAGPGSEILLFGSAGEYFLSDGSSWNSGAGSFAIGSGTLRSVERFGSSIRYTFNPPSDGILYRQTDYNAGDHSSQGELGIKGPLVLIAEAGSATATMSGNVVIKLFQRAGREPCQVFDYLHPSRRILHRKPIWLHILVQPERVCRFHST